MIICSVFIPILLLLNKEELLWFILYYFLVERWQIIISQKAPPSCNKYETEQTKLRALACRKQVTVANFVILSRQNLYLRF